MSSNVFSPNRFTCWGSILEKKRHAGGRAVLCWARIWPCWARWVGLRAGLGWAWGFWPCWIWLRWRAGLGWRGVWLCWARWAGLGVGFGRAGRAGLDWAWAQIWLAMCGLPCTCLVYVFMGSLCFSSCVSQMCITGLSKTKPGIGGAFHGLRVVKRAKSKVVGSVIWLICFTCTVWSLCWYHLNYPNWELSCSQGTFEDDFPFSQGCWFPGGYLNWYCKPWWIVHRSNKKSWFGPALAAEFWLSDLSALMHRYSRSSGIPTIQKPTSGNRRLMLRSFEKKTNKQTPNHVNLRRCLMLLKNWENWPWSWWSWSSRRSWNHDWDS